jgi:hypothetical protein
VNNTEAAGILTALESQTTTGPDERAALRVGIKSLLAQEKPTEQQCETCGRPLEMTATTCACGSRDLRPVYATTTRKP